MLRARRTPQFNKSKLARTPRSREVATPSAPGTAVAIETTATERLDAVQFLLLDQRQQVPELSHEFLIALS